MVSAALLALLSNSACPPSGLTDIASTNGLITVPNGLQLISKLQKFVEVSSCCVNGQQGLETPVITEKHWFFR